MSSFSSSIYVLSISTSLKKAASQAPGHQDMVHAYREPLNGTTMHRVRVRHNDLADLGDSSIGCKYWKRIANR